MTKTTDAWLSKPVPSGEPEKCAMMLDSNTPCSAQAVAGSHYCQPHLDEIRERAREALPPIEEIERAATPPVAPDLTAQAPKPPRRRKPRPAAPAEPANAMQPLTEQLVTAKMIMEEQRAKLARWGQFQLANAIQGARAALQQAIDVMLVFDPTWKPPLPGEFPVGALVRVRDRYVSIYEAAVLPQTSNLVVEKFTPVVVSVHVEGDEATVYVLPRRHLEIQL